MADWLIWIFIFAALGIIGLLMFALGTRTSVSRGSYCETEDHWWFGWFVRCKGGTRCAAGLTCVLQWRQKGTEHNWADAGVVPGGSVNWSENMEYRCVCG